MAWGARRKKSSTAFLTRFFVCVYVCVCFLEQSGAMRCCAVVIKLTLESRSKKGNKGGKHVSERTGGMTSLDVTVVQEGVSFLLFCSFWFCMVVTCASREMF